MDLPQYIGEHPLDVLRFIAARQQQGERCALVTIVGIIGRTSRNLGAQMAVRADGQSAGYVSSGCIDANVIASALQALEQGQVKRERYGEGSPYFDLKLACGGGLELLITPDPDAQVVTQTIAALEARRPASLMILANGALHAGADPSTATGWHDGAFTVSYEPKLRIVAAGRGQELVSLAAVAISAGFEMTCLSPDNAVLEVCRQLGCVSHRLSATDEAPLLVEDRWTAIVLLFHDHEWEPALIEAALQGDAFYIGALGSRRTHQMRLQMLSDRGAGNVDLARVNGPIGLVPAMRNAPMLAISTLAEIIDQFGRR